MDDGSAPRRTGDRIAIPGDYQFRATYERSAPQRFWHQTRFHLALQMLAPEPGMRVLDVGCGSGVFAALVASRAGTDVTAIDGNPAAIEFGQHQFRLPNLKFLSGHIDALRFPNETFDRISLLEVIEHVFTHQAKSILMNLRDLLKPGGRLVISTPNAHSAWPVLEWLLDRLHVVAHMDEDQHVASYSTASLHSLAASAGLTLLDSRTVFIVSPLLSMASWPLASKLARVEQRTRIGSLLVQSFERPLERSIK